MDAKAQTWVTVDQAAREVGISPTTIRDWYRAGSVDSVTHPSGRVVDLDQVRARAMGFAAPPRVGIRDRIQMGSGSTSLRRATLEAELTINVVELQQLARERLQA